MLCMSLGSCVAWRLLASLQTSGRVHRDRQAAHVLGSSVAS